MRAERGRQGVKWTYVCPRCLMRVYGAPTVSVICGDCKKPMLTVEPKSEVR